MNIDSSTTNTNTNSNISDSNGDSNGNSNGSGNGSDNEADEENSEEHININGNNNDINNDKYEIPVEESDEEDDNTDNDAIARKVMHRRMYHINKNYANQIAHKYKIDKDQCIECVLSKAKRGSHKRSGNQSSKRLDLVFADIAGPVQTTSIEHESFVLLIIDDYSRKVWSYCMEHKSDTYKYFVEFVERVTSETNQRINRFRTDCDPDFDNPLINNYYLVRGIKHETTMPNTPQQNGRAERCIQTIFQMARTALYTCNLSYRYWNYAIMGAMLARNRAPHQGINGRIPEEVWSGRALDDDILRVFGCICAYVDNRLDKFDLNTRFGVNLGYCDHAKGYYIIDLKTKELVLRNDVKFFELSFLDKKHYPNFCHHDGEEFYFVEKEKCSGCERCMGRRTHTSLTSSSSSSSPHPFQSNSNMDTSLSSNSIHTSTDNGHQDISISSSDHSDVPSNNAEDHDTNEGENSSHKSTATTKVTQSDYSGSVYVDTNTEKSPPKQEYEYYTRSKDKAEPFVDIPFTDHKKYEYKKSGNSAYVNVPPPPSINNNTNTSNTNESDKYMNDSIHSDSNKSNTNTEKSNNGTKNTDNEKDKEKAETTSVSTSGTFKSDHNMNKKNHHQQQ